MESEQRVPQGTNHQATDRTPPVSRHAAAIVEGVPVPDWLTTRWGVRLLGRV